MFRADIDEQKNLVSIAFSGVVPVEEVRECASRLESLLPRLRPGFRLLTDLSALASMNIDAAPAVERMMDLCNRGGVETVVRVVPDPHKDIGLNIMSLFHYRRRVKIVTCETIEAANEILAR